VLVGFVWAFAAIVGLSAAIAGVAAPAGRPARCQPGQPCGAPPVLSQPLVNEQVWRSSQLGFSLEYPGSVLTVARQGPTMVELAFADGSGTLLVRGAPSTQSSPAAALASEVSTLKGTLSGLARDTQRQDALLGTNVGYLPGTGGAYVATVASPQGASQMSAIAIQAASNGRVTITATAILFNAEDQAARAQDYEAADAVFNTVRWAA
jgi:hypothetical protein